MCGITATIDKKSKNAINIVLDGLNILQNRGYDSFGIGCIVQNDININDISVNELSSSFACIKHSCITSNNKTDGYQVFHDKVKKQNISSHICMGHTRWATHGIISDINTHPHNSYNNIFNIVHNGIIENYLSLKQKLIDKGFTFYSDTDTEIIASLIEYHYIQNMNKSSTNSNTNHNASHNTIINAINDTVYQLEGTYGLVIHCKNDPDSLYLVRKGSPLHIGENENYIIATSECSGFNNQMRHYITLDNNSITEISKQNGIKNSKIYQLNNCEEQDIELTSDPYKHWTLKEIMEQDKSLLRSINNGARTLNDEIKLGGLDNILDVITNIENVIYMGCGTSYHAALIGTHNLKKYKCVNCVICVEGSEFTLNDIPNKGNTLIIMCSQSGETMDLKRVFEIIDNKQNIITMGIINGVDSIIAKETDCGIYMNAGREVAVASTKSFTSSVLLMKMFNMWLSFKLQTIKLNTIPNNITNDNDNKIINTVIKTNNDIRQKKICHNINKLVTQVQMMNERIDQLFSRIDIDFLNADNLFILGKGEMEYVSKEIALKMKEICYIHAEGYSGSALKHGPFALLKPGFPVILLIDKKNADKMMNAYNEIKSRKSEILVITEIDNLNVERFIRVPENKYFQSIIFTIILQHISYQLAIARNINPDKPRNLAKVVTVE